MNVIFKVISAAVTVALLAAAAGLGAGAPLSPARIAKVTGEATDNLRAAEANIDKAVTSTEALARIERNVASQLQTSRRLLETQLGIEESSKQGLELSKRLVGRIGGVADELRKLVGRLEGVGALSSKVTGTAESSEVAATELEATLDHLIERYEVAVRESRELNRKARAFERVRP